LGASESRTPEPSCLERVDHLVYVTPDLDRGITEIELLLGMSPTRGGRHPNWGTGFRAECAEPGCQLGRRGPRPAACRKTGACHKAVTGSEGGPRVRFFNHGGKDATT
jgi:hypothetical protein